MLLVSNFHLLLIFQENKMKANHICLYIHNLRIHTRMCPYPMPIPISTCVRAGTPSCAWLSVAPWTIACQALLSMGFSRQEYWSGLPFSSPGDLPDPGIKRESLASPALAGKFFTSWATREALCLHQIRSDQTTQSCPTLCDPMNCNRFVLFSSLSLSQVESCS